MCLEVPKNLTAGRVDVGGKVTAKNIIIATGSVPFVPPGIPIDGKTVRLIRSLYLQYSFISK